jgi:hypothetical protein
VRVGQKGSKIVKLNDIPADYFRSVLEYNADTGDLFWKQRPREMFTSDKRFVHFNRHYAGKPAGYRGNPTGISVKFTHDGTKYVAYAHQLAWLWVGRQLDPELMVDHKDGDPHNNRLDNLRQGTNRNNMRNRKVDVRSHSGVNGVRRENNKWSVHINTDSGPSRVGLFEKLEDAIAARRVAEVEHYGEFRRRSPEEVAAEDASLTPDEEQWVNSVLSI